MGGLLLRLRSWWDGADRNQRTVAIVGGGFLAVLMAATYLFATKPHMGLLATGLNGAEQGGVIQELQKMGVPYEMDVQGDINAPVDKIPELRARLAMSGKLPASGAFATDSALKDMNMVTTPAVERQRLKVIAESELAQSIEYLDGVESAQVHLALADDSPFLSDAKKSSASVTVFEKPGSGITKEQARGIAMMVASSVPDLDANSVTVLNRRGEALVDPSDQTTGGGKVASTLEIQQAEAKRREEEIQSKLDEAFGGGNTIATVDLEIDFNGKKYTQTTHTPSQPLVTDDRSEKMTGGAGGGVAGGVAGVGAVAAPGTRGQPTAAVPQGYENKDKQLYYVVDDTTTEGEDPAGEIKSMAISVLVDKKVKAQEVKDWLTNYLGPRANDPQHFTASVSTTTFDTSAQKAADDAAKAAGSAALKQQIFSLLPIAALIVVALIVIKSLGKFAKTQTLVVATPDGRMIPLPANGLNLSAESIQQSGGALQITTGSGGKNPIAMAPTPRVRSSEPEEEDLEIDSIKRKINVPLEQIKKMSDERPEVVAMLIKSWLMEERR